MCSRAVCMWRMYGQNSILLLLLGLGSSLRAPTTIGEIRGQHVYPQKLLQ